MAQKLDANLNVIQETPIELELINGDLSIISKLDDEPNDVGGLTSTQLKAKFDEAGNIIKEYLNESLIPAVLAADATEATRSAAEAERVENEQERVANEIVRVPAETARIAAENIRVENEANRVASEEERIAAEATRKANEAQRIINENAREDLETGYVARAEAAAKRAEDAAADAENTVGGDYVTQEELDSAIGAIPTPEVYTKTETLADETAALFGLGADAVADDVFAAVKALIDSANAYADTKAKIATGSYVGTGTYGASNPCSLTFDFAPKAVFVTGFYDYPTRKDYRTFGMLFSSGMGMCFGKFAYDNSSLGDFYPNFVTVEGNTMYWYTDVAGDVAAVAQANAGNGTYFYTVIG